MAGNKYIFTGKLKELTERASSGSAEDVSYIINHLTPDVTLAMTKFVDYSLGLVENEDGIRQIEFYLHQGTQIQRNYCSLFFNRRGDWAIVKKAYQEGAIDEIQAFAR